MKMNGPEKSEQLLANMDEEEIQTLGNSMSTLGEIDTPVMDPVNRDFYNLVETGSSKLNAEGMDFLESALMKIIDSVKASKVLKNITSPG
jgi:flagellar motor switch protein FliG